ncbi:E3 ubiquitin-protein ligase TRIM39-like [Elgaria multicarinata webbii]|uniref:E3 ubiquitin-protein ligase TRIM39-like n=1 Tax=Elgaria multicarinata webbii TaxID=159646 RepID=UPI002FCCE729
MATASSAQRLQDEASCSLCHKYFTQPVSVDCGHSFCQSCITQHWEKWGSDFSCPRCGEICLKRKFRPNKELENFVQIAKQMNVEVAESVGGEKICETHQEPLKLFCKDEQKLMCSTCVESKDQTNQTFVPVEEAVQDYKEKLETQLQAWRQKREKAFNDHTGENDKCKMFRGSSEPF